MAAETPVVIETAVSSRPSPTFTAEATLPPPVTPTQQPLFVPTDPPLPVAWRGEYYNNRDLSGIAALIRDDASLNFDWGLGVPASGIPADNFSVRWERTLFFNAGTYRFHVRGDDGVRVWVDNQIIIDQWHDAANNSYSAERLLTAGNHTLIIAYYENTGQAGFSFWWEAVGQFPQWQAEYFANTTLSGIPVLTRNDMEINFDWGGSNPVPGTAADNFSVRWRRSLSFEEGNYRFHALIDDMPAAWPDGSMINRDVILVYLATADFEESASAKFNYVQAGQPGLSLSPTQGALGSVVTITGSGFPAASRVEIYLSTPDNRGDETSYAQANTSQKGNFVIQFTLPTKWANGEPITGNSLRIAASGENNIQAAVDFLLLNGTVE